MKNIAEVSLNSGLTLVSGEMRVIAFKGKNTFKFNSNGWITFDPAQTTLVFDQKDSNKIMVSGRSFLCDILTGNVTEPKYISEIEMGVGGYGADVVQVDPFDTPLEVPEDASDLILPLTPRWSLEIDPVTGIEIPVDNLFARVFTAVIETYPDTFDKRKYIGPSEFALRFNGTIVGGQKIPGPIFAKKHKRPLMDDGETKYIIRWTIKL